MSSNGTINEQALKQLFTEARTFNAFLPKEVSDQTLREIYELTKWGPTSANTNPMRLLFVKSAAAKEKMLPAVHAGNLEKTKLAPVTAIIAQDMEFYEHIPKLFPHNPKFKDMFVGNVPFIESFASKNSTLQGAYFMMAARALGLDCGPMAGFDAKKMDEIFFAGTSYKSNFICNLGYGDKSKLTPRLPRLNFDEACKIV